MHACIIFQVGRAGKQVVREGSDEDDVPLAQRKRKGELALKLLVDVVVPIHQLLLIAPRNKVIEPVQSKLINRMTIMMTMKTSL
jgi:hypothetical protein